VQHHRHGDIANFGDADLRPMEAAARTLGRQLLIVKAGTESEIDSAFAAIVQAGAGALFVGTGALYNSRRRQPDATDRRLGVESLRAREYVVMRHGCASRPKQSPG
jgi:putative ABC transport system substrate-binding protein